jgi:RNase adapter protein RapZ
MPGKQVIVLSGLAGAGKSTAARALEDLGFFVVDNLPPALIEPLIRMTSGGERKKFAFVVDAREAGFLREFPTTWSRLLELAEQGTLSAHPLLLFLDCDDDVLVRRFQETRRRHPLDVTDASSSQVGMSGLYTAIAAERALLAEVKARADTIIDTRGLSVHDLKRLVSERFGGDSEKLLVTLLSFGFKYGLPADLDLCFDARFLQNPYFVETLRHQTGRDAAVRDYVFADADASAYLDKIVDITTFLVPRFALEGKSYATVAIGCTGGRHRSVALVEAGVAALRARGIDVRPRHRDVERG